MGKIMKKIIYFGIIQFRYENAMCQRTKGIKKMISELGYETIVIGFDSLVQMGSYIQIEENVYAIKEPHGINEWIKSCFDIQEIVNVIEQFNKDDIEAIIVADYRLIPMVKLKKYCENKAIKFIVDIMDWFTVNWSIKGIIKKIDNDLRMYFLYPKIERKIYICSKYKKFFGEKNHCCVIPGVVISKEKISQKEDDKIKILFAGRPEKKCKKEKIDWLIKAIGCCNNSNRFDLSIAGISKEEFIRDNPQYAVYIKENIHFWGRISHEECIELLKKADFSCVIRPNTKLSNYGFSTKIGESFTYNIPVIATDTSDNNLYIKNNVNGYICDCDYLSLEKMITEIGMLSNNEILDLKKNIYEYNPLFYDLYMKRLQEVLGD